jgi:iron complex outermembrane receptor protein
LGSGYANEGGSYSMSQYTKEQTNLNATFNALKNFEDWTIGGFVRGEYYNNIEQYNYLSTNGGLIVPGQYFINNSKENVGYDGYISGQKRMYSIASQFSASWADQVFVDVTGRNDWSSSLVYLMVMAHFPTFTHLSRVHGCYTTRSIYPNGFLL